MATAKIVSPKTKNEGKKSSTRKNVISFGSMPNISWGGFADFLYFSVVFSASAIFILLVH
jgi:hypothetical protein